MINSEDLFASAEKNTAQERETMIAAASAQVGRPGRTDCLDCGGPIPDRRREAAPFALRCVDCQNIHESRK